MAQLDASRPLHKRLWRQVVTAKIQAQAAVLEEMRGEDSGPQGDGGGGAERGPGEPGGSGGAGVLAGVVWGCEVCAGF